MFDQTLDKESPHNFFSQVAAENYAVTSFDWLLFLTHASLVGRGG